MTASKQISDARAFVAEYCEEALVLEPADYDRGVAIEHLDFNVAGSLGQEASPVILHRPPDFGGGDALG